MTHKEKLIMNRIENNLNELSNTGVGIITDYVQECGELYYRIDDTVIIIAVATEK